jgi:hypothetical protein
MQAFASPSLASMACLPYLFRQSKSRLDGVFAVPVPRRLGACIPTEVGLRLLRPLFPTGSTTSILLLSSTELLYMF